MSELTATLRWPGDIAAGIRSGSRSGIPLLIQEFDGPEDRERARKMLSDFYEDLHGEPAGITFSDECADCLGIQVHHPDCPVIHAATEG